MQDTWGLLALAAQVNPPPPGVPTTVSPTGRASVTTTLVAGEGPALVTVRVHVT